MVSLGVGERGHGHGCGQDRGRGCGPDAPGGSARRRAGRPRCIRARQRVQPSISPSTWWWWLRWGAPTSVSKPSPPQARYLQSEQFICVSPRTTSSTRFLEGVYHQGVIAEVGGRKEVNVWMVGRHPLGVVADAADQHAGEQE